MEHLQPGSFIYTQHNRNDLSSERNKISTYSFILRKVLITFVTTKSCSVVNLEAERNRPVDIEDILNAFQIEKLMCYFWKKN